MHNFLHTFSGCGTTAANSGEVLSNNNDRTGAPGRLTENNHHHYQGRAVGGGGAVTQRSGDKELHSNVIFRRQCRFQAITNAINNVNQNGNILGSGVGG